MVLPVIVVWCLLSSAFFLTKTFAKHRQNMEANIDTIDGEGDNNIEKDTDMKRRSMLAT